MVKKIYNMSRLLSFQLCYFMQNAQDGESGWDNLRKEDKDHLFIQQKMSVSTKDELFRMKMGYAWKN